MALVVQAAWAAPTGLSLRHLSGPLSLATDAEYFPTNWLVYLGRTTVTVIGATWTPAMARTLARRIRQVSRLPIATVIDTSPDPEWSGGNAYWKRSGARILAVRITDELLKRTCAQRDRRARNNHPGYPLLPLVRPTEVLADHFTLQHGDLRAFYLGPTHTPGDIFVYFPREQLLDAGSIVKPFLGNMADADVRSYRRCASDPSSPALGLHAAFFSSPPRGVVRAGIDSMPRMAGLRFRKSSADARLPRRRASPAGWRA